MQPLRALGRLASTGVSLQFRFGAGGQCIMGSEFGGYLPAVSGESPWPREARRSFDSQCRCPARRDQGPAGRGYSFVTIDALRGIGYHVVTSNGGVHNFGAPWYGSLAGKLPAGVTTTGIAADPVTGGYWVLKSNGGSATSTPPGTAPWPASCRPGRRSPRSRLPRKAATSS
jgi:hypothetical protein